MTDKTIRSLLGKIARPFGRLHRDEQGDEGVNKVLIIALIAVPLVIVLLVFGGKIVDWFSKSQENLAGTNQIGTGTPGG